MDLLEVAVLKDNLYWAWQKVRNYYSHVDGWFDELEVARFELNLERELGSIADEFKAQHYSISPLRPLPQPKRKDSDGIPQTRQMFWVQIRDQVAWAAYVNVIGPALDWSMPPWSYGNRLFRSVWFDDDDGQQRLRIGHYRNTKGQMYRPFRQSWPVYRRKIHLTVRRMAGAKAADLTELDSAEQRIFQSELRDIEEEQQLPYLQDGYWTQAYRSPVWLAFDLEKFYPHTNLALIKETIRQEFSENPKLVRQLLDDLLTFPLDTSGFHRKDLKNIELQTGQAIFEHLPTGLMVAGFLANVALLRIDQQVQAVIRDRQIAHFRYVDDHVVLAPTFDRLQTWLEEYQRILRKFSLGATLNPDKFEPAEFGEYIKLTHSQHRKRRLEKKALAQRKCRLDPRFPTPLMTQTLAKVSDVNRRAFELLDEQEQDALFSDLEHLLLAEFPTNELRADTRVTFAASRIARLSSSRIRSVRDVVESRRRMVQIDSLGPKKKPGQLARARREYKLLLHAYQRAEVTDRQHTLRLLLKALSEFPEKIRLWQKVMIFCQKAGQAEIGGLIKQLRALQGKNQLAAKFIEASLLQTLSHQILLCGRILCDVNALPQSRKAALRYLRAVLSDKVADAFSSDGTYYLSASRQVFAAARGLVAAYVSQYGPSAQLPTTSIRTVTRHAASAETWSWTGRIAARVGETQHSMATWIWWAESSSQPSLAVEPGLPWRLKAEHLSPKKLESWAVWCLYPAQLPKPAMLSLRNKQAPIPLDMRNYLLAAVADARTEQPKLGLAWNLADWIGWVKAKVIENPFDPRLGEWTCLEIANQVAMAAAKSRSQASVIHPHNFIVPNEWAADRKQLSWEKWRSVIRKSRIRMVEGELIRDFRWSPGWVAAVELGNLELVGSVALLLLGLIRRDFRWPALWNRGSPESTRGGLVTGMVRRASCSSLTAAILEGCLLPRQRESILLRLTGIKQFGLDDTTRDPPEFDNLEELQQGILKAENVLEGYQISVQGHQPRQMIPVCLTQLTRTLWARGDEHGEQ